MSKTRNPSPVLVRFALGLLIAGTVPATKARADLAPSITTTTLALRTSEKVLKNLTNPTSNEMTYNVEVKATTRFNSKAMVKSIREQTRSDKFKVDASAKGTVFSTECSASAGYELETLVKTSLEQGSEVEEFKEKTSTETVAYKLAPKDRLTVYEYTTSGPNYSHSWTSTEKLPLDKDVLIKITARTDLTPVFLEMLNSVVIDTRGIRNDAGEWGAYSKICQEALVTKSIHTYINRVSNELWTTGLDRNSWSEVIAAARRAKSMKTDTDRLATILLGFSNVRSPSHNDWAWAHLQAIGDKMLAR